MRTVADMRQRGSISVEFAVVLPLAATILLGVAQIGVTVAEVLVMHHAAREGARTFAVTGDADAGVEAAIKAGNLDERADVTATIEDDAAVIEIVTQARVFPGLPPSVRLRARAAMRRERWP